MLTKVLMILVFSVSTLRLYRAEDAEVWTAICDKRAEVQYFRSYSAVLRLIQQFESNPGSCPETLHPSIRDLAIVLTNLSDSEDVCGIKSYRDIRHYYSKYVSVYTPESSKEQLDDASALERLNPIPESLRRFFILLVQQITAQCKIALVTHLEEVIVKQNIFQSELDLMDTIKEHYPRLIGYEYLKTTKHLRDLQIPLSRMSNSLGEILKRDDDAKLFIQVPFGDALWLIKKTCVSKLIPVYEELFFPVILLMNLGFSGKIRTGDEDRRLDGDKHFTRWYGIIQTCELLRNIEILHDIQLDQALASLALNHVNLHGQRNGKKSRSEVEAERKIVVLKPQEAYELMKRNEEAVKSGKALNLQMDDSNPTQVEHQLTKLAAMMWLSVQKECEAEVKSFEKKLLNLIQERRSSFTIFKKDIEYKLEKTIHKAKLQFLFRDRTTAIGQVASFLHKYKHFIRAFLAILSLSLAIGFLLH